MIKFETINGQICRMVEPEPLTNDVKFPCVVRMIQDDSPMGRNNDFYATSHLLAHIEIINGLDAIHFVRWQGSNTHYSRFEIIGYPVADGSAEWALYHVLHKERRALTGYVNDVLVHIQNTEYGIGLYYSGKIMPFDFITPEQFIEGAAHTGWQLYEPEPEPEPEEHPAVKRIKRLKFHNVKKGDIAVYQNSASSLITQVNEEKELFATGDYTWANEITWYNMTDGMSLVDNISPVVAIVKPEHLGWKILLEEYEQYCDKCGGWGVMQQPQVLKSEHEPEVKAAGVGLNQKMLMALEGDG
jgi:hypothetical protein